MNTLASTILALSFCPLFLYAAPTGLDQNGGLAQEVGECSSGFAYVVLDDGVQFRRGAEVKNVLFYGTRTVRVNTSLGENHWTHPSLVVVHGPTGVPFEVVEGEGGLGLRSAELQVTVNKQTGALTFSDSAGRVYTRECTGAPQTLRQVTISGKPTYEASNTFTLRPDEGIYGFGYTGTPGINRRGADLLLVQTNINVVVPVMLSTENYGILWDVYSKMTFRDNEEGATLWAESAPGGVDYYFFSGRNMDEVVAAYRDLTGAAPMYPRQAFGLFMSKERYPTQERLGEVARAFREEGFPLDYIVQDWLYWGGTNDGTWSGMMWDASRFPDPAAMTRALHDMDVQVMISIWPAIGDNSRLARDLDAKGLRFRNTKWTNSKAGVYDAYSAEARGIYFRHVKESLLDVGIDALWMDGTEVEVDAFAAHDPAEVERAIEGMGGNAMGDFCRYLNTFSLMTTRAAWEGQRATGDRRVVTLTRSSWAGQQRFAAMPWFGDTTAGWKTLEDQIAGGISVSMSGLPFWTQDTGGFFVNYPEGERNPEYRELFARWNQFAIFNPVYRIHGTSVEREPYIFKTAAPEVYQSLLSAAQLRYRLLPYIYSLAWASTAEGYTMARGLPMDFPDDLELRGRADSFMFGPAFLVHPITRAMYHIGDPIPATIPADALQTPDGKPGLSVQYFSGTDFNAPAGSAVDAALCHDWPTPPPGLADCFDFSSRWGGSMTAPEDGEYELGVEYDDGARLYVDGRLILDDWSYGAQRYRSARLNLSAGQRVALKVEFHQGGQSRFFRLCWRRPSDILAMTTSRPPLDNTIGTRLPKGADWFDFWTNELHSGGSTVVLACPMDVFPLFVRAGSIVPFGPQVQNALESLDAPIQIRSYRGADALFRLYEDDNVSFAYERGQCATVELDWDDSTGTLTIGPRNGSFPGMVARRELHIDVMEPGVAPDSDDLRPRVVEYDGSAMSVQMR